MVNNKGFTLIELIIVIGIIGVLTGSLAFYGRSAERQIILFRDQAKIIEALLRAKSLAISTYSEADAPCGYGVSFDPILSNKTFVIFKDLADDPACIDLVNPLSDADNIYSGNYMCDISDPGLNECVEKLTLDEKTIIFSNLTLRDIIYFPPNLDVIIDNNIARNTAEIKIQTFDGVSERKITITNNGQITTE